MNKKVSFIGYPNVGKSLLFNRLTACSHCVGNWSGVTASCQQATSTTQAKSTDFVDLPGCYYLPDQRIDDQQPESTRNIQQALYDETTDLWVNVIDANILAQQLMLTLALLEQNKRLVVVINHMDTAKKSGLEIDCNKLSSILGVPVVAISAKFGTGINQLKQTIDDVLALEQQDNLFVLRYPQPLENIIQQQLKEEKAKDRFSAVATLIQESQDKALPSFMLQEGFEALLKGCQYGLSELATQIRRAEAKNITQATTHRASKQQQHFSKILDKWLLHKWVGLPCFFILMFSVFWMSMFFGQHIQVVLEPIWRLVCIDIPAWVLVRGHAPMWLVVMLTEGIGMGIVTALSFLPVLFCVFVSLYYLEESGYMSRAAVVMDRVMRALDLPGESLVALILGFGCNVPGILATKHITRGQDRITTALMMPFVSCSARLSIFAVFCATLSKHSAAQVLFFLYTSGMAVALLTGYLLKRFVLNTQAEPNTYLLELPTYQRPIFSVALTHGAKRSMKFVYDAMIPIVLVCAVLACLNHLSINGQFTQSPSGSSALVLVGKVLTNVFYPLGITQQQWPLVVALITGLLAKEVTISTLGIFYAADYLYHDIAWYATRPLMSVILHDLHASLDGLYQWSNIFNFHINTVEYAWLSPQNTGFATEDHLISYLLFTLLYFPCISTLYAIAKEVGWFWAKLSLIWSCVTAYIVAMLYLGVSIYIPWAKSFLIYTLYIGSTLGILSLVVIKLYHIYIEYEANKPLVHEAFK